ncbi:predicted protein [Sclerotinia sclerotiorum 1980 UF-70]|uniref:Uncharacterized protein n=1 Tax=Sclerotinia sclerotiorum (strain ATCC 18683 / 1980 / Ss-1) TaxID=665079 RepID=A7EZW8_SCLS1|nr:predicted protein [Sclerotinia sclerotiorum 1980 UF-70]EDN95010.1 predicted protein [Sclerotinia sclerotiorum 1980 UF-70]
MARGSGRNPTPWEPLDTESAQRGETLPWERIAENELNNMARWSSLEETEALEKLLEQKRDEERVMPKRKHSELDNDGLPRDPMYEMILPLNALTKLSIAPELEALQGAYADSRYIMVNLTYSIPDLSVDSQNLTASIKGYRKSVWTFSEAMGDYGAFLDMILNNLQEESKNLGIALSKLQPEDKWQNRPDSEQGRKIAAVWITHYEWLERELENTWEETLRFEDEIEGVIEKRKVLEKAFDITQPRMTKEAEKRDLKNFDFPAAYNLIHRFGSVKSLAPGDRTKDGYETRLEDMISSLKRALEFANGEASYMMEKLQKSHIQKSTTESQTESQHEGQDETDENENKTNNASSLTPFEIPNLQQQIEALTATYESYLQVKIYLSDMKHDLTQHLKGKVNLPEERIQVYDYVLSGRQDSDYMKRQSGKVNEVINKKEERKRLKYRRRVEQEEKRAEKLKKQNWKPWHF